MIKTLDNILPHGVNRIILNELIKWKNWTIADDFSEYSSLERMIDQNKANTGFGIISFHRKRNIVVKTKLNDYGDIIYFALKEKYKLGELERLNWNYYDNSSETSEHTDETNEYVSAVYSLHTNDGGTEVKGRFYPSVEGQAIIFDSDISHRGIPPKQDRHRFNLALVIRR